MKFTKMQGIGNDYIYVNCFKERVENPGSLAVKLSDRHFGIGSDGLVLIMPSDRADLRMRMFNSDGSEAEMCGNAIRCVGKYVYDNKMTEKKVISVETLAGIKILDMKVENGRVSLVTVDMGEPVLKPEDIPVNAEGKTFIAQDIKVDGKDFKVTCVSMGNPHAVSFVGNTDDYPVLSVGPEIEKHHIFPRKINAEFVQVINRQKVKMRVWERGAGETLACGTGACAAAVACVLNGLCDREVTVKLLGGDLNIKWSGKDNHVYMTGPAVTVFNGEV